MNTVEKSRQNNFDFVRLSAAFAVLISHQFALNARPEPVLFHRNLGTLAVLIFFSVSGFLVSQSWRQDPHALRFLAKRFLRVWPGLAAATLIAAFLLGPAISSLNVKAYFAHPEFESFLLNLQVWKIRFFLPGVFKENNYPGVVNGSFWTIPLEVNCYVLLLAAGCLGIMAKKWVAVLAIIICGIYYFGFAAEPMNYQYHFALYFFAGVSLDLYRRAWENSPLYLLAGACAISLALLYFGADRVSMLFLIPVVAIYIGTRSTPVLSTIGKYGDISYGIYIYAFPVQQTTLWALGKDFPFIPGLVIAAMVTTFCAFLSWHFVEKNALRLKSYLVRTKQSPTL